MFQVVTARTRRWWGLFPRRPLVKLAVEALVEIEHRRVAPSFHGRNVLRIDRVMVRFKPGEHIEAPVPRGAAVQPGERLSTDDPRLQLILRPELVRRARLSLDAAWASAR